MTAAAAPSVPLLTHARDEEDLVVHGQPEQDSHDDDRQEGDDGTDLGDGQEVGRPSPTEHGADGAHARPQ